jgi:hypothetical protein
LYVASKINVTCLPPSTTPTPEHTRTNNYYAALAYDDDSDSDVEEADVIDRTQHQPAATSTALSDSGATSHFIADGAHVINKQIALHPITITLPNGSQLQSTHTCQVDIPWLRPAATQAHIVLGLSHASLLATAKFCDAGYTVTFNATSCLIHDGSTLVLKGERDPASNLWQLPLRPQQPPPANNETYHTPHDERELAHNVHTIPHLQNRVKFMHQVFFCPPLQTLLRAANLGFLEGFPFLTPDLIHKHLPNSPATAKGRLKLVQAGHRSTRRQRQHHEINNIFCFAALADKQHGTFYSDCTGRLPARALDGQQLFFVAFDYDTNYIFALPFNSTSDKDIMDAFQQVHQILTAKGYKPVFNVTDNQAATPIKTYMAQHNGSVQFVEPNNHHVNAAERAIQTFKNHFISGLCTTDPNFPFQLWNHLTNQAVITCNILRRS